MRDHFAQSRRRSSALLSLNTRTLMGKGAGQSLKGIRKARAGKAESALDAAVASFFAPRGRHARSGFGRGSCRRAFSRSSSDAQIIRVIGNVAINVLTDYTNNVALTDIGTRRSTSNCIPPPDPDGHSAR